MATATRDTSSGRRLTIGAVRDRLADEFPDISISKIRYLEGRGLLAPRRTQSGYRLYSDEDVERLRTILRLQRQVGEEGQSPLYEIDVDKLADDESGVALEDLPVEGTALVVRAGGGRQGETFPLDQGRHEIGRSPDAEIFLDDVTVSRSHAIVTHDESGVVIEDLGSLNGTYVNRRRVDKATLEDGDEVQIGKYRLTLLSRS